VFLSAVSLEIHQAIGDRMDSTVVYQYLSDSFCE